MTKEEAFKINELYRKLDTLESTNKIQAETIERLKAENKLLAVAINVDELLTRVDKINKKKD